MNRPLPWSDAFAVGHAEIDREHRQLVEAINEIGTATQADTARLPELLEGFRAAVVQHLRKEDALLREIRSGGYRPSQPRPHTPVFLRAMAGTAFDEHFADHQALLARFDVIAGGPVQALAAELMAWFIDHAIRHDAHMRAIFQSM